MTADDIAKGVREGWLVPEADGWHRFVFDFEYDARGCIVKVPARASKRVRVVGDGRQLPVK